MRQLVNNEVFSPELNDSLKYMFLDMKETAKIVSLKPFANESLRKSEFKVSLPSPFTQITTT